MLNITLEEFIKRANEKHNFIYDYSLISKDINLNYKTKVPLKCQKHGTFIQTIGDHVNGVNCQACAIEITNEKKKEKFYFLGWMEGSYSARKGHAVIGV